METLNFTFAAGEPPLQRTQVGCVGSGDLEVLVQPAAAGALNIRVITSVNGSAARWQQLFERMFAGNLPPAMQVDIHDFGATPGVVRLRLEQALEEVTDV